MGRTHLVSLDVESRVPANPVIQAKREFQT
jgi:hypothetical protein